MLKLIIGIIVVIAIIKTLTNLPSIAENLLESGWVEKYKYTWEKGPYIIVTKGIPLATSYSWTATLYKNGVEIHCSHATYGSHALHKCMLYVLLHNP